MSTYCPKCGARNEDNALVCRVCGKTMHKSSDGGVWVFILIGLVVAGLLLAILAPFIRQYVSPVGSKIVDLMQSPNQTANKQNTSTTTSLDSTSSTTSSTTLNTTTALRMNQITAVNVQIAYYDNTTNSYRNYTETYNAIAVAVGSEFSYTLPLSNPYTTAYEITAIEPSTSGFELAQTSPSLPYILTPGSMLSITSFIYSPNTTYTGTFTLRVSETELPNYYTSTSTTTSSTSTTTQTTTVPPTTTSTASTTSSTTSVATTATTTVPATTSTSTSSTTVPTTSSTASSASTTSIASNSTTTV